MRALPPSNTRSARIDVLRGASILSVLLLHFSLSYDLIDSPLSRIIPKSLVERLVLNGNYGVTIFFAIFVMLSAPVAAVVSRYYAEPLNGVLRRRWSVVRRPQTAAP